MKKSYWFTYDVSFFSPKTVVGARACDVTQNCWNLPSYLQCGKKTLQERRSQRWKLPSLWGLTMPSFILSDNFAPWLLLNVPPHCSLVTSLWTQLGSSESKLSFSSVDNFFEEQNSARVKVKLSFFHRPSGLPSRSATSDTVTLV